MLKEIKLVDNNGNKLEVKSRRRRYARNEMSEKSSKNITHLAHQHQSTRSLLRLISQGLSQISRELIGRRTYRLNEVFTVVDIESQLKLLENNIEFKAETDAPISCSEVKKVISGLKLQKSAGPDRIINEIIKTSNQVIIKSIVKIFNLILKKDLDKPLLNYFHQIHDNIDINKIDESLEYSVENFPLFNQTQNGLGRNFFQELMEPLYEME
ncbi:unnamed protein product [Mytilus coruscus]|uniref:Uncharacterized protein n=1 Tax=Mytilus coruscus TaxID=42192 RepID=A0A6J8CBW1_MYTCO|nr:unnamed protein product [Mytilus coruscus]